MIVNAQLFPMFEASVDSIGRQKLASNRRNSTTRQCNAMMFAEESPDPSDQVSIGAVAISPEINNSINDCIPTKLLYFILHSAMPMGSRIT